MSMLKTLSKIFTPVFDDSVEVSGNGVLHVDATRLLKKEPVKRQLEAARRLQHGAPSIRRKIA
ncbi:MAG TPA: hypothetical protein VJS66_05920 [Burkholderiales bacterium]|nr:hypothetical protein [Burkholderiales bacterium]